VTGEADKSKRSEASIGVSFARFSGSANFSAVVSPELCSARALDQIKSKVEDENGKLSPRSLCLLN
jgi:hypothetical protein